MQVLYRQKKHHNFIAMSLELEEISIQQQFKEVIASEDKLQIQDFLNNQNISDVADLIYDNEDFEGQIISHLLLHRAASYLHKKE